MMSWDSRATSELDSNYSMYQRSARLLRIPVLHNTPTLATPKHLPPPTCSGANCFVTDYNPADCDTFPGANIVINVNTLYADFPSFPSIGVPRIRDGAEVLPQPRHVERRGNRETPLRADRKRDCGHVQRRQRQSSRRSDIRGRAQQGENTRLLLWALVGRAGMRRTFFIGV